MRLCSDQVVAFDVDDTLISFEPNGSESGIEVFCFNQNHTVYPNQKMITQLKAEHANKKLIIVWSQQGDEWSDAVARALGLELFVHITMTKVSKCFDDLPIKEWMTLVKVKI